MEHTLKNLRTILENAASKDTAYNSDYSPKVYGPLHNHCAVVAYVVQDLFGGIIISARYKGITHYWNMLDSGAELDFTSDQFGGDGIFPYIFPSNINVKLPITDRFRSFQIKVAKDPNYVPFRSHLQDIQDRGGII